MSQHIRVGEIMARKGVTEEAGKQRKRKRERERGRENEREKETERE
jgi:hypothetical protein